MYSPEFLNQLQEYLQAAPSVPFQTWLANKNNPAPAAPTVATPAPVVTTPAPTVTPAGPSATPNRFADWLAAHGRGHGPNNVPPPPPSRFADWRAGRGPRDVGGPGGSTTPAVTTPAVVPGTSMPPAGYRPGIDPEWNYGFLPPVKGEAPAETKKKASGGTVSTGNAKADAAVAAGDQKVINNLEASAMYAAQDNAANGTPIPEGLKQFLPNGGGTTVNLNKLVDIANGKSSTKSSGNGGNSGQYTGFWDRINGGGPGAGYTGLFDMVNGGGMGGSYANPGTNIRGLGAVVNDLRQGGISALWRDALNGAGLGASGDNFRGGKTALFANLAGVNPAGSERSIFNNISSPANPELEKQWAENQRYGWKKDKGTKGTAATGEEAMATGGIVDSGVPVHFAQGGIADIPDPAAQPAQPPMGNEKELISSTIAAIKGQVEDPRPILGAFLAKYGEEALRNLVDKVESGDVDQTAARSGGMLKGPGDGMDDRIPAKVEGGHDVLLANNEYVVPADVISALGNGSSDAGAEHMDKMLERVRTAAHGKSTQQKKVSADKVLPA